MIQFKTIKRITFALAASILFSLSAFAGEAIVPSTLAVQEIDRPTTKFVDRRTYVKILDKKKKSNKMIIGANLIRKREYNRKSGNYETLVFSEKRIDKYVDAIDKYLSWEEIAQRDGDIVEKHIKTIRASSTGHLNFNLYSVNSTDHYLMIYMRTLADALVGSENVGVVPVFSLNRENAVILKTLLTDWKAGNFDELEYVDADEDKNKKYK